MEEVCCCESKTMKRPTKMRAHNTMLRMEVFIVACPQGDIPGLSSCICL